MMNSGTNVNDWFRATCRGFALQIIGVQSEDSDMILIFSA